MAVEDSGGRRRNRWTTRSGSISDLKGGRERWDADPGADLRTAQLLDDRRRPWNRCPSCACHPLKTAMPLNLGNPILSDPTAEGVSLQTLLPQLSKIRYVDHRERDGRLLSLPSCAIALIAVAVCSSRCWILCRQPSGVAVVRSGRDRGADRRRDGRSSGQLPDRRSSGSLCRGLTRHGRLKPYARALLAPAAWSRPGGVDAERRGRTSTKCSACGSMGAMLRNAQTISAVRNETRA